MINVVNPKVNCSVVEILERLENGQVSFSQALRGIRTGNLYNDIAFPDIYCPRFDMLNFTPYI